MRVVLDTSAIIYLNDFRSFEEIITSEDVIKEVKDKISSIKLSSLNLNIMEPKGQTMEMIERSAKETGDFGELSKTDMKVLALAKENDCTIISDDRSVQNVAEKLGIKYVSIFNERIKKMIMWKKYCKNCRKYFEDGEVCPICGGKIVRLPAEAKNIR